MRRIAFLHDAREEVLEAAAYYEEQAPGLGEAFVSEVEHAVALAVQSPELGTPGV